MVMNVYCLLIYTHVLVFLGGGYENTPLVPSASPSESFNPTEIMPILNVSCGTGPCESSAPPTYSYCKDIAMWEDSNNFSCKQYEEFDICDSHGDSYENRGYVANQACCFCGGGIPHWSSILNVLEANPKEEECVDLDGWSNSNLAYLESLDGVATCADFVENSRKSSILSCNRYGHVVGEVSNVKAVEGCCTCNGGYKSNENNTLFGTTWRVGYSNDSESTIYYFSDPNSGFKNGSIPQFMRNVARSFGFGMYDIGVSENSTELYPTNPYNACLRDLAIGLLDICIGPFPIGTPGPQLYSPPLYLEEYYLIVPIYEVDFWESLATPFLPFTFLAWLSVFAAIVYMTLVYNIVANKEDFCCKRYSIGCRFNNTFSVDKLLDSFYSGLRSFTTLDVADISDEPSRSEKVIIAGFVIFALVVVTAYTATAATALFVAYEYEEYSSFVDVLGDPNARICLSRNVLPLFVAAHPESQTLLSHYEDSFFSLNVTEMAEEVRKGRGKGECDVAVVTARQWELAVVRQRNICEKVEVLPNDVIFEVEIGIAYSNLLDRKTTDDLYEAITYMYESSYFNYWDDIFYREYVKVMEDSRNKNHNEYRRRYLKGGAGAGGGGGGGGGGAAGTAAVSSSASTSQSSPDYLTSVCSDDKFAGSSFYSLDYYHLSMPVVITTGCTTLGLLMFCYARLKEAVVNDEVEVIENDCLRLTPSELLDSLQTLSVNEDLIKKALNHLPDKSGLVALLVEARISEETRNFRIISSLEVSELCDILQKEDELKSCIQKRNDDTGFNVKEESWKLLLNDEDLKDELARRIMQNELLTYVAITRAKSLCLVNPDDESIAMALLFDKKDNNQTGSQSTRGDSQFDSTPEKNNYTAASPTPIKGFAVFD